MNEITAILREQYVNYPYRCSSCATKSRLHAVDRTATDSQIDVCSIQFRL
jgi:hypothetical protein